MTFYIEAKINAIDFHSSHMKIHSHSIWRWWYRVDCEELRYDGICPVSSGPWKMWLVCTQNQPCWYCYRINRKAKKQTIANSCMASVESSCSHSHVEKEVKSVGERGYRWKSVFHTTLNTPCREGYRLFHNLYTYGVHVGTLLTISVLTL